MGSGGALSSPRALPQRGVVANEFACILGWEIAALVTIFPPGEVRFASNMQASPFHSHRPIWASPTSSQNLVGSTIGCIPLEVVGSGTKIRVEIDASGGV